MRTIIFEVLTDYGLYVDALNIPDDATYTDEELEQMKQQRVQNWINDILTTSIKAE